MKNYVDIYINTALSGQSQAIEVHINDFYRV